MTGLWIALGIVALALLIGAVRRITDGRARTARKSSQRVDAAELGIELAPHGTFVQFSTSICAPCRATARLLSQITEENPAVAHVEIDAEHRMDLVERFGVLRTPTVLLVDAKGAVRYRFTGPSRRAELVDALARLED
ncbi:Thiol-disulfide isomerase or thioredoxin [Propionibacterium cyclohexanicum]|uniref:Thiol-disulfide isomerase or thioredoxin n=1 Tax=Propionibacterium cyclohexanicum TaxID=64702 RepID=A0A1H9RNH0_9ACTN|nr:thioredoxin family protein [Propionibacterium cyclohexanicum]SER74286.1 Thiol-disulfide isomerase or thioredoxin [Propionibacterium cyclohexanicum]